MSYASLFAPSPFLNLPSEMWDSILSFSHGEEKDSAYEKVFSAQEMKNKVDSVLPRQNRSMRENKVLPREQDLDLEVNLKVREKAPKTKRKNRFLKMYTKPVYPPKKRVIKRAKVISHEEDLYKQSLINPYDWYTPDCEEPFYTEEYYQTMYEGW
ncbi:Hypothetical protein ZAZAV_159 [Cedratvirus Zaza IHUMI]|uniref:Uncharacterized protein n=1 Tax=Cedratvirus Zaza IHUMI TaxID=2126979 RepID=A0A2R8FDP4_9VIRU|nr:Hypothetical protein ZAZAV_159 [Cedratvirus Zaza IHUMI]